MTKTKPPVLDAEEVTQETSLTVSESNQVTAFDPSKDILRAKRAADQLKDIIRQNNWAKSFRPGQKEHIFFEGWQTVGKFYNCTVDTDQITSEYVEYGGVWGFKAHAAVIDNATGRRVGGASALCMSDEQNWRGRDKYAINSMAQTRAGSKALRDVFAFVVALAGYEPTPAEEMIGFDVRGPAARQVPGQTSVLSATPSVPARPQYSGMATPGQVKYMQDLLLQKHYTEQSLLNKYDATSLADLTFDQASECITQLKKLPVALKKTVQTQPITAKNDEPDGFDYDEIDKGIARMAN